MMFRPFKILKHAAFGGLVFAGGFWTMTAFRFHLAEEILAAGVTLTGLLSIGILALRARSKRAAWVALVMCGLAVAGWYQTITPQENLNWAADVSRGVIAHVDGDLVELKDVRDFRWQTPDRAAQRWTDGTYDLSKLIGVDVITSVWDSPDFAHLLVSFGFEDRENIVFSVEIRREAGEAFNEVGGFFRQFELVLIAATEQDIIKLRTDVRKETVSLFPVNLTMEQKQDLFLSYVALAQDLAAKPAFYNTLTANCTTVVFQLANTLWPKMPLDWRLVLSGHVPDYLQRLGVLVGIQSMEERWQSALLPDTSGLLMAGQTFSEIIRTGK
ncbi:DUF4105 domain-containing protein [Roseibium sp.]|uniref:Lnb N-terminal periplasmic domain-containing protein n=1 Tax=Roseibium sp. TaxID=1936156 RepID=UPI003B516C39